MTNQPSSVPDTRRKIEDGWWWVRRHGRPNPQPCKVITTNAQYVELDGEKFYSDQFHNLDFIRRIPSPDELERIEAARTRYEENFNICGHEQASKFLSSRGWLDHGGMWSNAKAGARLLCQAVEQEQANDLHELLEAIDASLTSPQAEGKLK